MHRFSLAKSLFFHGLAGFRTLNAGNQVDFENMTIASQYAVKLKTRIYMI